MTYLMQKLITVFKSCDVESEDLKNLHYFSLLITWKKTRVSCQS